MNHKEILQTRIKTLEAHVASQREVYEVATKCLAQTRAALSVNEAVAKANGKSLSREELEFHHKLICEAVDNVTRAQNTVGEMSRELREMENELVFL